VYTPPHHPRGFFQGRKKMVTQLQFEFMDEEPQEVATPKVLPAGESLNEGDHQPIKE